MRFSLIQPLGELPLAFVDVETTGASADFGHKVIELGIVRVERGQIVAEYQQLCDPQRRISPGVTALTGIAQSMVDGQPTFTEQLPCALPLLEGAAIVGHNVRFDLGFLRKEFRRAGSDLVEALGGKDVPVLDTVRIARRRFGRGGNGLQALAPRLGVLPSCAHRALADAQTTAAVFERLMEPVGGWRACLCDALSEQGGPMGLLPLNPGESLLPLELEEALERRSPVRMEYLDARQKRTHRIIEPLHVRRSGGELLLIAHCHLRADRRTFKLERIVQLTRVDGPLPATCEPVPVEASPATVVAEPVAEAPIVLFDNCEPPEVPSPVLVVERLVTLEGGSSDDSAKPQAAEDDAPLTSAEDPDSLHDQSCSPATEPRPTPAPDADVQTVFAEVDAIPAETQSA